MEKARYRVTIEALEEGGDISGSGKPVEVVECLGCSMALKTGEDKMQSISCNADPDMLLNWMVQNPAMLTCARLAVGIADGKNLNRVIKKAIKAMKKDMEAN